MIVELINTGNELMLGRVLNTHQQWICRQLADAGYVVNRQTGVSDNATEIEQAVRESLSRADLIITTGGLGPTSDDRTRDAMAKMLGCPLREDEAVLRQIERFFTIRNRPMPQGTYVEAQVPEGAIVFLNRHGTAPGLAIEVADGKFRTGGVSTWLIMLPGPPRELRPMFIESVMPLIQRVLPTGNLFVCRTIRTNGIGESAVQERIQTPLQSLVERGLEVGYCARPGQVDVRFTAAGSSARELVDGAVEVLHRELDDSIYAEEDGNIEEAVVRLLKERSETLAVAESCTGGHVADRITNVPGASDVFLGGFIAYSNDVKRDCAGVSPRSLETHGAVSDTVARELAEGTRSRTKSDYALAITGIAGPGGGSEERPVGTVFIALATKGATTVLRMFNPWDRQTFKEVTSQQALNLLRRHLMPD